MAARLRELVSPLEPVQARGDNLSASRVLSCAATCGSCSAWSEYGYHPDSRVEEADEGDGEDRG